MRKATVGFMAVGLQPYWGQFEGMRENCEFHHQELKGKFNSDKVEIEDVGIIDSEELAREAGKTFEEKKVEVIFCQMLTYAASVYIAPVVRNLSVPVVILNVQYKKALDYANVKGIGDWLGEGITCAGVPEATAVLSCLGKQFAVVTGHMEKGSDIVEKLEDWCDAALIKSTLANGNLGLFGHPYQGMMDLCVNESRIFEKFGTYVYHLDWEEIIREGEKASSEDVQKRIDEMGRTFDLDSQVQEADIAYIARTAEGLERIAEKYRLHSFATHYEFDAPESQVDLVAALNPAMTLMMTEGMANAPEGDIKSALAMVIMRALAGNAMTAELYSMDFTDGICLIGHSGACDANISREKAVLKMSNVFHGKSGKGYMTQFHLESGAVTMLALTEKADGNYKLVAAEGMSVEGPVLQLGDTNLRVKFPMDMEEFVNAWSMEGPSHHGVLSKGLHVRKLRAVAKVLGLELKVITEQERRSK